MFSTSKENQTNVAKENTINEGTHVSGAVKAAAHNLNSDARDTTAAVRDDLESAARRTGHHVRELAESAGHSLTDVGESMALKIRKNPIQSSFIALGVGLVAGMLYRR